MNHVFPRSHPMASPPAKSAKYHHDPRFMDQILIFNSVTSSHVLCDEGEVVPIHVHAFCHPVAEAIVVPRLSFSDIFPSISPVIHRMPNVRCYKIHVDETMRFILLKFDEVFGSFVPICVDCLQKLKCTAIALVVSFGFVFPCVVTRFERLICLLGKYCVLLASIQNQIFQHKKVVIQRTHGRAKM